jgi:hypothetical protein
MRGLVDDYLERQLRPELRAPGWPTGPNGAG